jgi:hypothetical protein
MEVSGQLHAPAALSPSERVPGAHYIRKRLGPRAGLDAVGEENNPSLCQESNLGGPCRSPVTILNVISQFRQHPLIHPSSNATMLQSKLASAMTSTGNSWGQELLLYRSVG